MHTLFEALRQAVLALSPCVNEEFLKFYVAYKAETNFVDVEPQAKGLRLYLNMPFEEIDDPKNLCQNMTNIGHLGNGCIKIGISSVKEIPYVISLIRQSFDRQMGSGTDLI